MDLKYVLIGSLLFLSFSGIAQVNPAANRLTKNLYSNIKRVAGNPIFFGHQDALSYGLNRDKTRWVGDRNRSDVKTVTKQFPAVVGYDLGYLELDSLRNLDGVPFSEIKKNILDTYKRGGINTISWHPNNPLNPHKTTWDKEENTIGRILNRPKNLDQYYLWLDKMASFFLDLKNNKGELIPVVFRPFHEHTGSWFWWGADYCTPEQYKQFWKLTVNYLIKKKGVNNLLFTYSTDVFRDETHYLERYPGDDYVDMLGFDTYHRNAPESNEEFSANLKRMLKTLKGLSDKNQKPFAITEMGLEQITVNNWWTEIILSSIKESGVSYFLVWRNGYDTHYYAPFQGQATSENFKSMIKTKTVVLEKGIKKLNMYSDIK